MRRHRDWWRLAFFVLLWFGATFAYWGKTGKYSDDWWTTSRCVDGVKIDWTYHPWSAWPYFWRPLHLAHVWTVNTLFWNHNWIGHLELALLHAAVCVGLYRVLLRLQCSRGSAAATALLFGTNPLLGEAVGWFSASCNAIGSLLMLVIFDLGCRFGSNPTFSPRLLRLGAIAFLSFFAACFYEPAAAGLAALPLIVWITCSLYAPGIGVGERTRRAIAAAIAAGIPCVVYVTLLAATAPSSERGAATTIGNIAPLNGSFRAFAGSFFDLTVGHRGRDIVLGSLKQGFGAVWSHPFLFAVVIGTTGAGIVVLVRALHTPLPDGTEQPHQPAPEHGAAHLRRGHLPLIGVVLMLASALPFVVQHNTTLPCRSLYVPLLGAAFLLAGIVNGLQGAAKILPVRARRGVCFGAATSAGLLVVLGQIGLIGMQTLFQSNARRDDHVGKQLAAMSPNIPAESAFMVLAVENPANSTACPAFNAVSHSVLRESAPATPFVRFSMQRNDVRVLTGMHGGRALVLVDQLSLEGVRDAGVGGRNQLVQWSHIIPIWIDAQGRIRVVERLTIVPLHGTPQEVQLPLTVRLNNEIYNEDGHRKFRLTETISGNSRVSVERR